MEENFNEEFNHIKESVYGWLRRLWLTKEDADIVSNLVKTKEDGEEFLRLCDKLKWRSIEEYYIEYENGNYIRDIKYILDVCNRLQSLRNNGSYSVDD